MNTTWPQIVLAVVMSVCALALHAQSDRVIATINGYSISEADVNGELVKLPLGDQVSIRADLEKFAESLIQEEVLFQSVLGTDFIGEESLRIEVKTLVVNHLIDKYVTQKLVVPEEDIEQFYNENTSAIRGETVQVRHTDSNP